MNLIRFLFFLLLNFSVFSANSTDLSSMFMDALLCKSPPVDARNADVRAILDSYHVTYEDREKESLADMKYDFKKPLKFKNMIISSVFYLGDSGSLFYAIASGNIQQVIKDVGAKPVKKDKLDTYGWGEGREYFKETMQPTMENPFPSIIIIGESYKFKPGQFYFGCEVFDG